MEDLIRRLTHKQGKATNGSDLPTITKMDGLEGNFLASNHEADRGNASGHMGIMVGSD